MNRRNFSAALPAARGRACACCRSIPQRVRASARRDYKALVCVFLYGGNDGNNTIVPLDSAGYAQYAAVRTAASGMQLAQASLLPIQPASLGTPSACIPSCPSSQRSSTSASSRSSANVGTLVQPTSKSQYIAGQVPLSLYLALGPAGAVAELGVDRASGTGWGGRIADQVRRAERGERTFRW